MTVDVTAITFSRQKKSIVVLVPAKKNLYVLSHKFSSETLLYIADSTSINDKYNSIFKIVHVTLSSNEYILTKHDLISCKMTRFCLPRIIISHI